LSRLRGAAFERVIEVEPTGCDQVTDRVPPVVVCNPDEVVPDLHSAPRRLRVVIAHPDAPGEVEAAADAVPCSGATDIRVASLLDKQPVFPLAAHLHAADEVFCAAGYNSFWEARWMGYEHKTTFVSLRCAKGEHDARLKELGPMLENGADVLAWQIVERLAA
jgi:hypothetical protein